MRLASVILAAASLASAAVPRILPKAPILPQAPNLPTSAFPKFHTLPLEDARAFKDLEGLGLDLTKILEEPAPKPEDGLARISTFSASTCQANPNMRIEWKRYPAADRRAFIAAIKCLMGKPTSGRFSPSTNRYEDLVRLHQMYMPNIHGNPKFMLWHRYYTWTFEQELRDECGFTRPMPWWDETLDAGKFAQSDMFTNTDYFGRLPAASNGRPVCIVSGAFAGMTCNIGPGTSNTPHCLSRAVDESATSQCNSAYVQTCNSRTTFSTMASCAETGPHAFCHNGIGGAMADVSASPSDPIFWMHHTFIDRNFRVWQNVAVSRRTSIDGVDGAGQPLTLDTTIYMGGIRPDVKVRDILNTLSGAMIGGKEFCYRYDY
ncbi:hypothetical protein AJ80_06131 [Polytolypa hystricis UAMH7299]|uniref:Tyrosinase copper-binding domain-containing protein n=1 Tax=Polytolypa hystricis (strain UAMH7299) TaxID=1447883 RepID=A0A2B7XYY6_POLH7|nr:hypothetical protein AJ80_06131 [Polytolypa hystricis UAMH7299]